MSHAQRQEILGRREEAIKSKFAKGLKKKAQNDANKVKRKLALAKKVKKAGMGAMSEEQVRVLNEGEPSFEEQFGMADEEPRNDGTSDDERLHIRNDERGRIRARKTRNDAAKAAEAAAAEAAAATVNDVEEHLREGWIEKQLEDLLDADAESDEKGAESNTAIEEPMPKRARTMPLWGAAWRR